MPGFVYRVIDSDGKERKGSMNASTKEQAEGRLISEGLIIVDVSMEEIMDDDSLFGKGRIGYEEFAAFSRQFSHFYRAGIGTVNVLKMMAEQTDNKYMHNVINYLIDRVKEGTSFSKAVADCDVFPHFFTTIVEAGETKGDLCAAMDRLETHFEMLKKRAETTKRVIIYPLCLTLATVLILFGVMIFIVPSFFAMFADIEIDMPLSSKVIIAISDFLVRRWYLALIILLMLALAAFFFVRSKIGRVFLSRFRITYQGIHRRRMAEDCAIFSRMMTTLLYSGIPLARSLELTANQFMSHVIFRRALLKARDQVASGEALSKQLDRAGFFPKFLINMISVGEETGNLTAMFENAADYYEGEYETAVRKTASCMEPAIVVILAIAVGFVIMAMLRPLLILYETVGNM